MRTNQPLNKPMEIHADDIYVSEDRFDRLGHVEILTTDPEGTKQLILDGQEAIKVRKRLENFMELLYNDREFQRDMCLQHKLRSHLEVVRDG